MSDDTRYPCCDNCSHAAAEHVEGPDPVWGSSCAARLPSGADCPCRCYRSQALAESRRAESVPVGPTKEGKQ